MTKEDFIRKLTRTKLWGAVIATLCALYLAVTQQADAGACAAAIAGAWMAYAVAEGYIDGKREESSQTVVSATSTDKATVAELLTPKEGGNDKQG